MGELRKLRLGNAENVVTPYTAEDDSIIINQTTKKVKVNPEVIATQDDLDDVKDNLTFLADAAVDFDAVAIEQIDSANVRTLSKSYKWLLGIVPSHSHVKKCQMLVPANSTSIVNLEKWELDNSTNKYSLSETITGAIVSQTTNGYVLDFGTFDTSKKTLLTYSDTSSGGWGKYSSDSNYSVQRFPSGQTTISEPNISVLDGIKFEYNLIYEAYKQNPRIVVVDVNGKGNYTDVKEAVESEPDNTVIFIYPGVYEGTVQAFEKRIILIGMDRNKCILKSTDGRYSFPAINCSCGYLENLTLISEYVSGESNEIDSSMNGAYAVHCENEYGVNNTLELHHCTLKSDFFPAMGAGLRKNFKLILDDCELINNQIIGRGNYSNLSDGSLGALYCHDSNGAQGDQFLIIKDCVLKSSLGKSMTIYQISREPQNNNVYCEFLGNVLYDERSRFTNNIWFRGDPFNADTGIFSIVIGYGNSNDDLNNN